MRRIGSVSGDRLVGCRLHRQRDRARPSSPSARSAPRMPSLQQEQHGGDERQATHCHNAHCATATPSMTELTTRIAVCTRGRPPERREREEAREEDEPEARQREERPARARDAERDRQADRAEQAVRGAEPAPGDHGQPDEEDEEGKRLEVDRGDAHRIRVPHRRPVDVRVRAGGELPDAGPARRAARPRSRRAGRRGRRAGSRTPGSGRRRGRRRGRARGRAGRRRRAPGRRARPASARRRSGCRQAISASAGSRATPAILVSTARPVAVPAAGQRPRSASTNAASASARKSDSL